MKSRMFVFTIGSLDLGIDVDDVVEIRELEEINPYPSADPYIVGITNIRGEAVVVYNLPARLGFDNTHSSYILIIKVLKDKKRIALMINEFKGIYEFNSEDGEEAIPILYGIPDEYIERVFVMEESVVIAIKIAKMLESNRDIRYKEMIL